MTTKLPEIPFSSFLKLTIAGQLFFAIPTIDGILLFNLIEVKALLFIIVLIALIASPISTGITWLIARGSNWKNTSAAITVAFSSSGRFYGVFFGGLLGFRLFDTIGGIIGAILFHRLAFALTIRLGKFLSSRIIPEINSQYF